MTPEQARAALTAAAFTVVELITNELAKTPAGAEPALGDGTFLANLIKLLEMLLPLILKFFPT